MTNNANEVTREIKPGMNGSGAKVWVVFTTRGARVLGMETFDNEAEALNWLKWA